MVGTTNKEMRPHVSKNEKQKQKKNMRTTHMSGMIIVLGKEEE